MITKPSGQDLVEQLTAAIASGAVPGHSRAWADRVKARLSAPVRVGILGPAGCNLSALANALLGEALLPEADGMPPLMASLGSGDKITIVTANGSRRDIRPEAFGELDPWSLAMAEFTARLPLLHHVSLLLVPLEGGERDLQGAINWAGQRCDMAVFCSRLSGEETRELWNRLPSAFLDHGFLCLLGSDPTSRNGCIDHPFRALHEISNFAEVAGQTDRLKTAILDHVATARREDLEGALLLLERYSPQGSKPSPPAVAPQPDRPAQPDFSELLDSPRPADTSPGNGSAPSAPTAEIISFLAAQADELAYLCETTEAGQPGHATTDVLALCTESIEACAEMAFQGEPAVMELFAEATDLVVLMQIESTPGAMSDAVALMLQLRHECETRLCA